MENKKKEREPAKIKVKFPRLVEGVASVYGIEAGRLLGTERKRSWVEPRSLHAAYVVKRDKRAESELQRWLNKSTTHA